MPTNAENGNDKFISQGTISLGVQELESFATFCNLDDLYLGVISHQFQSFDDKIISVKPSNTKEDYSASFHILRKHKRKCPKLDENKAIVSSQNSIIPTLSTEAIIELAAENFIQSASKSSKELSVLNHPYSSSTLSHSKDVQLIVNLLSCAEKVDKEQYDRAVKLLDECYKMSSPIGSTIQRLAFYFIEALYEKVGRVTPKGVCLDPLEAIIWPNIPLLALHKGHPLPQITKFAGIQTILDHVVEARKIHVIDLEIRSGIQYTILFQALVDRSKHPVEHLRITALGTKSKETMEETGKRLMSFAESLKISFSFDVLMVADVLDLKESLFKVVPGETVAVYTAYALMGLGGKADRLEHIMRVIKDLNPCVMIIAEIEANCSSPSFIGRFVESLFFYGAIFDSFADCMKNDETNRREVEATCLGSSIKNVLAAEGDERKIRHMSIRVWRAFLARFGIVEIELSMSCVDQAYMVLQGFPCGRSCTVDMNGKCLIIAWKGTPLSSLSAWKFK
ncbi:hypothetical protein CDL12_01767 [Handroanthus impetiginosus]|uniref:Uncharacterized protein n=1 Tax=Handroanthus impetiginosus TaxID=429701 RepID=A0A2G9I6V8_9LAMI|nr:hypothetical protein CDL12_01767 [Handroanthus impetiginosus]